MNKDSLNNYAKYSSIGFQMIVIVLVGVFGGIKLDGWLNTKPLFTITLSVLSIFLGMYYMLKDLIKFTNKSENDENSVLLTKAPRGKEGRAALLAIESDITSINTDYDVINGEIETSENLFITLDKAKAIEAKALSINDELKTAIGKK